MTSSSKPSEHPDPPGRLPILSRRAFLGMGVGALAWACSRPADPTVQRVLGTPEPTPDPTPKPTPTPPPRVRFAAVGDIGQGNDVQRRVGERIAALHREDPFDVLLLLGDIIYPNGQGYLYEPHFTEPWHAVFAEGIRMEGCLGNHDVETNNGADIMELFGFPARWFSFSIGPATFYSIETNHMRTEQVEWFRETLASSQTPWNIPFMHAPLYSSGMHGDTEYVKRALEPIINEHRLPLVLTAHDHDYERTHPIGGTVYTVTGTACCLRPVGSSDFTAVSFSEEGVQVGEVTPEHATIRFVHSDGRILDETTIPVDLPEREAAALSVR